MKPVDYEHFGRFVCPHTLTARADELYFCEKRADFEENKYRSDLFRLKNGAVRRLTSSGDVGEYHLLPEGIVFPSLREKRDRETAEKGIPLTVLQRLPWEGGEAEELLRLPYRVTKLLFLSARTFFFTAACSREWDEALAACGGDAEKAAARRREDADYRVLDEVPFVLNGEGFINGVRGRLFRFRDGEIAPVTQPDEDVSPLALSSDGKTLWYASRAFRGCDPFFDRLFALDTETLEARELSIGPRVQHLAVFPLENGLLAALAVTAERRGLNENPKVFVREAGVWRQSYGAGAHDFCGSLCSDVEAGRAMARPPIVRGGEIFLLDTQDESVQVIALDPVRGTVRNVSRTCGDITDLAAFGGGFAMIAARGNGGSELWALSPEGGETRLTDLNTALCAQYEYAEPQPLSFVNERGTEIRGWVIPPAGLKPGQRCPSILDIHGGPKAAYGSGYFHEMQLWAAHGFAVLFCNPTGGDGRGDEFIDIFGDYGGQDYRDLMAFTDEALRRFAFLDPARMGVAGGSYGGFMTNWIIGHTDRFRAAASQRSIANWTSFQGTSDIGFFFQPDQNSADLWTDAGKVWAQSPLKYADRAKTPTLFIHSDEDYRCPLSEGLQMFSALRAHGVEARLCLFRGENHELSRSGKPKHRVRRLLEITQWFETHLQN